MKVLTYIKLKWVITMIALSACVSPIDFNAPPANYQIIIEGMISDDPGPYTVKVSRSMDLDTDTLVINYVQHATIKLFDDNGNVETLKEVESGTYQTAGLIQGQIGHSYYIQIQTLEGRIYESEPDRINPGGEVENIRYEFEGRTVKTAYGQLPADVFNVYIDAHAVTGDNNYARWRYTGRHKLVTNPEERTVWSEGFRLKAPPPCSGYVVGPGTGGGNLVRVGECTCCTCWISQNESAPVLSDRQFASGNEFRNIKVGEVPVDNNTFAYRYMVQVDQFSLSKNAFEFFNLVRAQKEKASSIFQPPFGELKGNVKGVNNDQPVVGIFWATSVRHKVIFLDKSDVPYLVTPPAFIAEACTSFANSSNHQPAFWE